jgi:hypothetical protein
MPRRRVARPGLDPASRTRAARHQWIATSQAESAQAAQAQAAQAQAESAQAAQARAGAARHQRRRCARTLAASFDGTRPIPASPIATTRVAPAGIDRHLAAANSTANYWPTPPRWPHPEHRTANCSATLPGWALRGHRAAISRGGLSQTGSRQTGPSQTGSRQFDLRLADWFLDGLSPDGSVRAPVERARSSRRLAAARSEVAPAPWTPVTTGRHPEAGPAVTAGQAHRARSTAERRGAHCRHPIPSIQRNPQPLALARRRECLAARFRHHLTPPVQPTPPVQRLPSRWRQPFARLRPWSTPSVQTPPLPCRHPAAEPGLSRHWPGRRRGARGRSARRHHGPRLAVRVLHGSARHDSAVADRRWLSPRAGQAGHLRGPDHSGRRRIQPTLRPSRRRPLRAWTCSRQRPARPVPDQSARFALAARLDRPSCPPELWSLARQSTSLP